MLERIQGGGGVGNSREPGPMESRGTPGPWSRPTVGLPWRLAPSTRGGAAGDGGRGPGGGVLRDPGDGVPLPFIPQFLPCLHPSFASSTDKGRWYPLVPGSTVPSFPSPVLGLRVGPTIFIGTRLSESSSLFVSSFLLSYADCSPSRNGSWHSHR